MSTEREYDIPLSISEMWRDSRHIIAVRSAEFKYIWDSRDPNEPELYDLQADPDERHNVRSRYAEQAAFYQNHVDAHRQRVAAQAVVMNQLAEPELDNELIRRLRDLGYLE
jgi:arylsulfatase A-like enzyme